MCVQYSILLLTVDLSVDTASAIVFTFETNATKRKEARSATLAAAFEIDTTNTRLRIIKARGKKDESVSVNEKCRVMYCTVQYMLYKLTRKKVVTTREREIRFRKSSFCITYFTAATDAGIRHERDVGTA